MPDNDTPGDERGQRVSVAPQGYRRLRADLEYDGTDFVGWQSQAREHGRTIQQALEAAIERVTGSETRVVGAGRTDAGVHATGQVAHFDTAWPRPLDVLQRAVNAVVSPDVVVTALSEVSPTFHARYDAREREYVYTILNRPLRAPLWARTAWHVPDALDLEAMRAASQALLGRHDFRALGRPMRETGSTTRSVTRIAVGQTADIVTVTVRADAFLRHMVRRMTFALVEAGRGRLTPSDVASIVASADPNQLRGTAPPQGLCLVNVIY